jgi:hypothetical protein
MRKFNSTLTMNRRMTGFEISFEKSTPPALVSAIFNLAQATYEPGVPVGFSKPNPAVISDSGTTPQGLQLTHDGALRIEASIPDTVTDPDQWLAAAKWLQQMLTTGQTVAPRLELGRSIEILDGAMTLKRLPEEERIMTYTVGKGELQVWANFSTDRNHLGNLLEDLFPFNLVRQEWQGLKAEGGFVGALSSLEETLRALTSVGFCVTEAKKPETA